MKRSLTFAWAILLLLPIFSQPNSRYKGHDGFQSVFQDMKTGSFPGTVNGVVFVRTEANREIILDFQAGKAELELETDEHEIYDVSTKVYHGFTTSGKTRIKYETYAMANGFAVELNDTWYGITVIDGAADMALGGIEFLYKAESSAEYLVLRISKELPLSNWKELNPASQDKTYQKKTITLLPESTLVFAIQR